MIEFVHIACGFASLALGLIVVLSTKGNNKHKWIGRAYFYSMLGLNITSLGIYRLYGGWGFFHWMAILSLATLLAGYIAIRYKSLVGHYYFINWSYIGLWCATVSEIFVHSTLAKAWQSYIPYLDAILIITLIIFGLIILPLYQNRFIPK